MTGEGLHLISGRADYPPDKEIYEGGGYPAQLRLDAETLIAAATVPHARSERTITMRFDLAGFHKKESNRAALGSLLRALGDATRLVEFELAALA